MDQAMVTSDPGASCPAAGRAGPTQPGGADRRGGAVVAMGSVGVLFAAFHIAKTAALMINLGTFPSLVPGDRVPGRPRTSILVPARDEAARLGHALPGLLVQPAEEILVLDDESSVLAPGVVGDLPTRDCLLTGTEPPAG
jgi:hypothetical protein